MHQHISSDSSKVPGEVGRAGHGCKDHPCPSLLTGTLRWFELIDHPQIGGFGANISELPLRTFSMALLGLWRAYYHHLSVAPLFTKCCTGCIGAAISDLIAQTLAARATTVGQGAAAAQEVFGVAAESKQAGAESTRDGLSSVAAAPKRRDLQLVASNGSWTAWTCEWGTRPTVSHSTSATRKGSHFRTHTNLSAVLLPAIPRLLNWWTPACLPACLAQTIPCGQYDFALGPSSGPALSRTTGSSSCEPINQ